MISDFNQSILYFCPDCSEKSEKKITVFDFPKDKSVDFLCANKLCRTPVISMKLIKDKYKITIECPACGDVHTYKITQRTFWNKEYFALKCPQANLSIFFVGKDPKRLDLEFSAQSDIIAQFIADECYGESNLDLLMRILSRIDELAENNAISCTCGSNDIHFDAVSDGIILSCHNCNYTKEFLFGQDFLENLLKSDIFII